MIVEQNNYTNISLHTIGKQLDYIENLVESQLIRKEPVKEVTKKVLKNQYLHLMKFQNLSKNPKMIS
ncbi:hypothetical protein Gotur_004284 [Gossypium turneri]